MRRFLVLLLVLAPVIVAGVFLWIGGGGDPDLMPVPPAGQPQGLDRSGLPPIPMLEAPVPGASREVPEGMVPPAPRRESPREAPAPGEEAPWVEGWGASADVEVGHPAPDFLLPGLGGEWLRLSDWRGEKAVIVNFWATWCPPCQEEMPDFERLRERRGHEVEIVAVNLYEPEEQVEPFIASLGLTFPVALDRDGEVSRRYLVRPLPTSFFIDRDGIIRARYFGLMSASVMEGLLDITLEAEGG